MNFPAKIPTLTDLQIVRFHGFPVDFSSVLPVNADFSRDGVNIKYMVVFPGQGIRDSRS